MSDKSTAEIAAEITIALSDQKACLLSRPDIVLPFYRAIYKEIATCKRTNPEDSSL